MGHSFIEFIGKEYVRKDSQNDPNADSLGEFLLLGFNGGVVGFFTAGLILNL